MNRIRVLAPTVADRIAAGEVVERPASVVKELVENALDAGATEIVVEVEGAGSTLIRVADDGHGIHADDVALAVRRFATSKIADAEDLAEVRTLGFRGEALPSIAAVSQFELTSAVPGAEAGRRIRIAGGEVQSEETVGGPPGTVVTVRHLFFNTPARRKFLKSPAREFALIVDAVQRLALAHPGVSFRMSHDGTTVLRLPAASPADRAAAVLGEALLSRGLAFDRQDGELRLRGWLGRPETSRGDRSLQYLFVNGRPVSSRVVSGAVDQAYRQIVPSGRHPVYVLFLDLPRRRVDVNVHPRKLEVRFDDDHRIFGAVAHGVRDVLRGARLIRPVEAAALRPVGVPSGELPLGGGPVAPSAAPAGEALAAAGRLPRMRLLGQLHRTYLLAQSDDGLIVIDQHAAHERVLYERLLRGRAAQDAVAQAQVAPRAIDLTPGEWAVLGMVRTALEALGFNLEPFGERTVLLRAVPQIAAGASAERLLRDLLAEAAEGARLGAPRDLLERLTIATACRTAVKAGDPLTGEQMVRLLQDLAGTEDPFTCFHGRPTMVTLPLEQVERWFLRRS
ncbi:MAG: DNA mismatch repair endonuclease MutL [Armatimonadota bacterium]|nr:DNA mismatch repair endonuclease MutL [Armatimonadota bacterium]MDR7450268.1 DNA mismatch repair endonuclease MutL [Armatimonadota bacterium]MDR7467149.1 DNA mismatch repair endonuclease MutL [Armatimonadota bacterium]MDR7493309.1 DNA mismatch repair endonuclease MutL [Armatimonadota bacterium]MDR7500158.1 DNA mismatch repair endonuclease MutL [Armatimonadota bacterium]